MNAAYENKKIMSKNLKKYMELKGKTRIDICNDLKISYTTFADWVNGKVYPRIDKLELLANYFGIDKSDLIEDKFQAKSEHSEEYTRLTDLCNIQFKSVITWTEDTFYNEYETIALRDHLSDLLFRYKSILETLNGAKLYWKKNKYELICFYRKRDPNLSEGQVKEIYLKQELEEKINDAADWISNLPGYISELEEQYEN